MRRIALCLLVLPFALAACSGTEARIARELTPATSVRQAATKTAAATSAHVALSGSFSVAGMSAAVTGSGDFDNANDRGSFHLDLSGGGAIDVVLDGNTAYVKAPFLASFLPAGKTWFKVTARSGRLPRLFQETPAQALARLKKVANVHKLGDETIDGTSTTHYQGRVTGPRGGQGTFDVWIGKDDGYVHRLHFAGNGRRAHGELVVTLSDFGKAVSITVPPASETEDATNLVLPRLRIR